MNTNLNPNKNTNPNYYPNPNLINTTYDPTRKINNIYSPNEHPNLNPNLNPNLFTYNYNNNIPGVSNNIPGVSNNIPGTSNNIPGTSNNIPGTSNRFERNEKAEKISEKIYNHFKIKYPQTIDASGFNKNTISQVVVQTLKRTGGALDDKSISKIIEIIDYKFKMAINGENRRGNQYNTTTFSMDKDAHITIDKYLENYTNKVSILVDSDKTIEADLPKNMSPATDMVKIEKPDPFNEDFPIRDREKQTDMMIPEVREYDYYVTIDSKDRDIVKYPNPNEFVIDFSPAPPAAGETRKGYIDRGFGNIKSCELMNVIIRDTSTQPDSSDAGGASFPYLLLQFDELQNNFFGTNNNISRTFAILGNYNKIGNFKYYRLFGDSSENTISRVYNPRINLNKITTRLLLPDGTPFNFGSIFSNDTSNTCITTSFRFTTIQKNLATQFIDKATY